MFCEVPSPSTGRAGADVSKSYFAWGNWRGRPFPYTTRTSSSLFSNVNVPFGRDDTPWAETNLENPVNCSIFGTGWQQHHI